MANQKDFDLDELPDFDMDEFDRGGNNHRAGKLNAARRAVMSFANSALTGASNTVKSGDFIRDAVKRSLPSGYGLAIDGFDEGVSSVRGLYDSAVRDATPLVSDLKTATRKFSANLDKALPKSAADALKRWSNTGTTAFAKGHDPDELFIATGLGDVFNAVHAQTKQAEVRDLVTNKLSVNTNQQLAAIRTNTARLAAYQDRITHQYHKKSLEIQLRHYVVSRKLLNAFETHASVNKERLEAISKNTGLPDYKKITALELAEQNIASAWLGKLAQPLSGGFSRIGQKLVDKTRLKLKDAFGSMGIGLSAVIDGVESANDMGIANRSGLANAAVGGLTGMATNHVMKKLSKSLQKRMAGNQSVDNINELLHHIAGNGSKLFGTLSNGNSGNGLLDMFMDWSGGADHAYKQQTKLQGSMLGHTNTAVHFNLQTRKSITDVIPGFLSKIHNEIHMMRTGKSQQAVRYSFESGEFETESTSTTRLKSKISKTLKTDDVKSKLEKVFKELDPNNELSPKASDALKRFVFKQAQAKGYVNVAGMVHGDVFTGTSAAAYADEISDIISKNLGIQKSEVAEYGRNALKNNEINRNLFLKGHGKTINRVTGSMNAVERSMGDVHEVALKHTDAGELDLLKRLRLTKVVDGETHIDNDKLYEMFFNNNPSPGVSPLNPTNPATPPHGSPPSTSGRFNFSGISSKFKMGATGLGLMAMPGVASASTLMGSGVSNEHLMAAAVAAAAAAAVSQGGRLINSGRSAINKINGMFTPQPTSVGTTPVSDTNAPNGELLTAVHVTNSKLDQVIHAVNTVSMLSSDATPQQKLAWHKRAVLGLTGLATGTLSKLGTFTKSYLNWGFKTTPAILKAPFGAVKTAGGLVGGMLGLVMDVYVKGDSTPVLTAKDLRSGKYIDETTKKVVKRLKDITGAVIDSDGNYIITKADFDKGLVTRGGLSIIKTAGRLLGSIATLPGRYFKFFTGGTKMIRNAMRVIKAKDIYVAGEATPRLLARVIRDGGYFLKHNGKVIRSWKDVLGDVIDRSGNVVLAAADIGKLVDVKGKPFRSIGSRIAGAVGAVGSLGIQAAKGVWDLSMSIGRGAGRMLTGGVKGISDFISGKGGISLFSSHAKSVTILEKIYQLLDERVPDMKPKNGYNPDGSRIGSQTDVASKRSRKEKVLDKLKGVKEKGKGMLSGIGDVLGKGKDLLMGGGMLSKIARMAGLGAVAATAAKAMGADNSTAAMAGGAALAAKPLSKLAWTGLKLGGRAAIGLLPGIATLGAGLLTFLASPVVLAVGAVLAIGAAGYMAYKYFTKKKVPIMKFRMAQYGYDFDDEDHVSKIMEIEKLLIPTVSSIKGKPATTTGDTVIEQVMAITGTDASNQNAINRFLSWFQHRFKPVFLSHMTELMTLANSKELSKADDLLTRSQKLKYLKDVHWTSTTANPYLHMESPFKESFWRRNRVRLSYGDVQDAFDDAIEMAEKEPEKANKTAKAAAKPTKDKSFLDKTTDTLRDMRTRAGKAMSDAYQFTKRMASNAWDKARSFGGAALDKVVTIAGGAVDAAKAVGNAGAAAGGAAYNFAKKAWSSSATPEILSKISSAAVAAGLSPLMMLTMAMTESNGNPKAVNPSGAKGLFQFMPNTWPEFSKGDVFNVDDNIAAAMKMTVQNTKTIRRLVKIEPEPWMLYLAHQQGAGGVVKLLQAARDGLDPATVIVDRKRGTTLRRNMDANMGSGMSAGQFIQYWKQRYEANVSKVGGIPQPTLSTAQTGNAPKLPYGKPGNNPSAKPSMLSNAYAAIKNGASTVATAGAAMAVAPAMMAMGAAKSMGNFVMKSIGKIPAELIALGKTVYTKLKSSVDMSGLRTDFAERIYGLFGEYYQKTKRRPQVNSAFRSRAEQQALYNQFLATGKPLAAKPGRSNHEKGIAIDINSADGNAMAKLGLLDKYGLHRPLMNHRTHPEPWHIEAKGNQVAPENPGINAGVSAKTAVAVGARVSEYRLADAGNGTGVVPPVKPIATAAPLSVSGASNYSDPELVKESERRTRNQVATQQHAATVSTSNDMAKANKLLEAQLTVQRSMDESLKNISRHLLTSKGNQQTSQAAAGKTDSVNNRELSVNGVQAYGAPPVSMAFA